MKEYQRKKAKHVLPHNVYMMTIYIIRNYDKLQEDVHDMILETPEPAGRSSGPGDPTKSIVIRREEKQKQILAIEHAIKIVPPEYQRGVMENIIHRKAYPADGHRNTYGYWKQRFIYAVAEELHLI